MPVVPNVTFNNGKTCPIFGLGTWKSQPGEVTSAVKDAISCGYRHIDGARCYMNEPEVGQGIAEKIADGTVTREELFITTKLWLTDFKQVVTAIKRSLKDLGLAYVDLYLIHWPCGMKEGTEMFPAGPDGKALISDIEYADVWKGMEECVKLGLAKSIGVSNFNKKQIEGILKIAKIRPVTNQVECHPYLTQKKLIKFCADNDITVTAYSPIGSPDRPAHFSADAPVLLEDAKVIDIAKKYKKSPGQVLIRYHIENGVIVIPKSVNKSRIESNIQVFDFELSSADMETLDSLNKNVRYCKFDFISNHPDYPLYDEY